MDEQIGALERECQARYASRLFRTMQSREPDPLYSLEMANAVSDLSCFRQFRLPGNSFGLNSPDLRPNASGDLDAVVSFVRKTGSQIVKIVGHSDRNRTGADGRDLTQWNVRLSLLRAESVRSHLGTRLGDEVAFETSGAGDSQPITLLPQSQEENRRVEVWASCGTTVREIRGRLARKGVDNQEPVSLYALCGGNKYDLVHPESNGKTDLGHFSALPDLLGQANEVGTTPVRCYVYDHNLIADDEYLGMFVVPKLSKAGSFKVFSSGSTDVTIDVKCDCN